MPKEPKDELVSMSIRIPALVLVFIRSDAEYLGITPVECARKIIVRNYDNRVATSEEELAVGELIEEIHEKRKNEHKSHGRKFGWKTIRNWLKR